MTTELASNIFSPSSDSSSSPSPLASHKPLKWLVTGGCGFIGTSLIRQLTAEGGHTIRVIDNLSVGTREDLASVCDFEELDPSLLSSLFPLSSFLSTCATGGRRHIE